MFAGTSAAICHVPDTAPFFCRIHRYSNRGQQTSECERKSLEMPGAGSAFFYRRQAERLTLIAAEINNPAVRLELLEIAANFLKLADYASANGNFAEEEAHTTSDST